jgi:hypothetical protein
LEFLICAKLNRKKSKNILNYEKFTHFQETDVEISVRAGLRATDTADNYRGEYLDCDIAGDVGAGLLEETLTALLGWQQLGSDQPKKMILRCDHFGCVALRHLMLWRADR